jgi:hypothetical protein
MADRNAVAGDLARHVREFLDSGTYAAQRPAVVGHMEELVIAFPDAEWYDELRVPLASYQPWENDESPWLYNADQLGAVLRAALPSIEAQAARDIPER